MTIGSNPTDRSKLGTKRHILTDKEGIPISVVISSASTHDVKLVIDVRWIMLLLKDLFHPLEQKMQEHENNIYVLIKHVSKPEEQEIAERGYVLHLPYKRKRGEVRKETEKISNRKKHPARRCVVERTNYV